MFVRIIVSGVIYFMPPPPIIRITNNSKSKSYPKDFKFTRFYCMKHGEVIRRQMTLSYMVKCRTSVQEFMGSNPVNGAVLCP